MKEPADEATEETLRRNAELGQDLAIKLGAVIDQANVTFSVAFNALGNLAVVIFTNIPLCETDQLEEFDAWCAYTRQQIVAEQHGEGQTRQ